MGLCVPELILELCVSTSTAQLCVDAILYLNVCQWVCVTMFISSRIRMRIKCRCGGK